MSFDYDKLRETLDLTDREHEQLRETVAYDRAMQKAFKGIYSRPMRHRMLMWAAERFRDEA